MNTILGVEYLDCRDSAAVSQAIRDLVVRGAPAIGIAAAYGVVLAGRSITAKHGADYQGETSGTIRFASNQSVRALYVPLKEHANATGHRIFEIELYKTSSGIALGEIARATVTIQKFD